MVHITPCFNTRCVSDPAPGHRGRPASRPEPGPSLHGRSLEDKAISRLLLGDVNRSRRASRSPEGAPPRNRQRTQSASRSHRSVTSLLPAFQSPEQLPSSSPMIPGLFAAPTKPLSPSIALVPTHLPIPIGQVNFGGGSSPLHNIWRFPALLSRITRGGVVVPALLHVGGTAPVRTLPLTIEPAAQQWPFLIPGNKTQPWQ